MEKEIYSSNVTLIEKLNQPFLQNTGIPQTHHRLVLKNGRVIDPRNQLDGPGEILVENGCITAVAESIPTAGTDRVIDCRGLILMPGLIDMHLHLGDLFDIYESPVFQAAKDGVILGLSPGAGNTFMAPSLIGAEVDRGLPINAGVYLGAASVLGTGLNTEELIALFDRSLEARTMAQKLSRNSITNSTAHLTVGIKDHMGHFIMPDERIEAIFAITSKTHLIYMSHTQDPAHAERLAGLSKGRPLHLAHATAAGCGTHSDGADGMQRVLSLVDGENITAEFVSSMLLENRGRKDGLKIDPKAQELAYHALQAGKVRIIISDGQSGSTMKGFGNTRDNIPCIFTLADLGVLSLPDAVAAMTANPARLLSQRLNNPFFEARLGHLGEGALANITIVDPQTRSAIYTLVNGVPVAFEGNLIREGFSAGRLVSKFGFSTRSGVGDLALYA